MNTLTWAQEQRIAWIGEMLEIYGFINRKHIRKKFRISMLQAQSDMSLFSVMHPGRVEYNPLAKQYQAVTK